jgi:hypothetical protein
MCPTLVLRQWQLIFVRYQTVENCKAIHGSLSKGFIVGGISAGGNLTAAVTHRSLKDPFFEKHKITGNLLQIPAVVHPAACPPELVPHLLSSNRRNKFPQHRYASELLSWAQNAEAPILGKAQIDLFYGNSRTFLDPIQH